MLLSVTDLKKSFGAGLPVIDGLTFEVARGEIFALLGPSACGKTTLLRTIAGFERPDEGRIEFDGRVLDNGRTHVSAERRGIGIVFQDYALFPHLTVMENVTFGLSAMQRSLREARGREVLKLVGMSGLEEKRPHELSGGQQQCVAIARSIAPSPDLLLLDEPFSNLDAALRVTTRLEVREVLKRAGITAVLVTHDQEEALSFADRLGVIWNGRIEQTGTPEDVYYRPRTLFVAQFLGRTNLVLSEANGTVAETPLGTVRLDRPASGPVLVSLRPEHLAIRAEEPASSGVSGVVVDRDFWGHDITYRIDVDGSQYLVHTDNRVDFSAGDRVRVTTLEPAVVLERVMSG